MHTKPLSVQTKRVLRNHMDSVQPHSPQTATAWVGVTDSLFGGHLYLLLGGYAILSGTKTF